MEYSGVGGKLIDEKNQKQKISWHCPFKLNIDFLLKKRSMMNWICVVLNFCLYLLCMYGNFFIDIG